MPSSSGGGVTFTSGERSPGVALGTYATSVLTVLVVLTCVIAVVALPTDNLPRQLISTAAAAAAMCASLRWSPLGALLTVAVVVHLAGEPGAVSPGLVLLVSTASLHYSARGRLAVIATAVMLVAAVTAHLHQPGSLPFIIASCLAGVLTGFLLSRSRELGVWESRTVSGLRTASASARSSERAAVARDLHDILAQQLSLIVLKTMAAGAGTDRSGLHTALSAIREAAANARAELAMLRQMLHHPVGSEEPSVSSVPEAVWAAHRLLSNAGFVVAAAIDDGVAALNGTIAASTRRAVQEATTNVLRHAQPGGVCRLCVALDDGAVVVTVTNPVAPEAGPLRELSLGQGLRGLTERMRLIGGSLEVGPSDGEWTLRANIPLAPVHLADGIPLRRRQRLRLWHAKAGLTFLLLIDLAGVLADYTGVTSDLPMDMVQPGRWLMNAAAMLAVWRPLWGAGLGSVAMLLMALGVTPTLPGLVVALTLTPVIATKPWPLVAVASTAHSVLLVASHGGDPAVLFSPSLLIILLITVVVGLGLRWHLGSHRRSSALIDELKDTIRQARESERLVLARDIHTAVAAQLDVIDRLAVHSDDPEVMRRHIDDIHQTARDAVAELRYLMETLTEPTPSNKVPAAVG